MIESIFILLDRLQHGTLEPEQIEQLKVRLNDRVDRGLMTIEVYKDTLRFIEEQGDKDATD